MDRVCDSDSQGRWCEEDVYTSVTKEMADTAVGIMDAFLAELIAEAKKLGTIEEPNGRNGKKRKA